MRDKSLRQPRDVEMLLGVPTLAVISSRNPDERANPSMAPLVQYDGARNCAARRFEEPKCTKLFLDCEKIRSA